MEKVKEVLHKVTPGHHDKSTDHTSSTTGTGSTTHTGPHSSGIANQADPRVDSDRDGSRNIGATQTHGTGSTGLTGHGTTGTSGYTGGTSGISSTHTGAHTGPHSSGLANQADPRVDSDLDASRNMGATQTHGTGSTGLTGHSTTGTGYGNSGTTGTGLTGSHGTSTGTHTGPVHNSNLANKLDPRVDSDADGSRNMGATQTHGTSTGYTGTSGTHTGTHTGTTGTGFGTSGVSSTHGAGPHSSGLANKADPRIDSDLDGSRNIGSGTTGTGYGHTGTTGTTGTGYGSTGGSTTAGPHSSNLANKLDPRVDSDRDGSKTVGGNM